jgi:hypothetical protein
LGYTGLHELELITILISWLFSVSYKKDNPQIGEIANGIKKIKIGRIRFRRRGKGRIEGGDATTCRKG